VQDGISAEIDRAVYIYAAGGPFGPKRGPGARVLGAPRVGSRAGFSTAAGTGVHAADRGPVAYAIENTSEGRIGR
jgi:hypothetical protein